MGGYGNNWGANDRVLDILEPGEGFSDEEIAVIKARYDPSANVNVYFIARGIQLITKNGDGWKPETLLGFAGKARRGAKPGVIYVADYSPTSNRPNTEQEHRHAIAHEIGHYIGRLQHPDQYDFEDAHHLPGTDNTLRLMACFPPLKERNPRMLIKAEWDALQSFFTPKATP